MSPDPERHARFLGALADSAVRRPRTVLAIASVLALAALLLAGSRLHLATSNLDLVDPDLPPVSAFLRFATDFGTPNALVVTLEGDDEEALRRAVDELEPPLAALPGVHLVLGRLPGDPALFAWYHLDRYLATRDRGLYLLFVQPEDHRIRIETAAPLVSGVEGVLARADLEAAGIHAGTTGLPRYAVDDRDAIRRDVTQLSGLAFVLVLLVFALGFAGLRRPLLGAAALLWAVALVLGTAALVPGHLTLLSSFFGSILFGLGIDFAIHLVHRIEELEREGLDRGAAIVGAVRSLAPALRTATATTSGAFLALLGSGFRGFAELGWLAAVGVALSLVAATTVFPALLVLAPGRSKVRRPPAARDSTPSWTRLCRHPATGGLALAALLALAASGWPEFDEDYLALQPVHSEAARLERALVARSDLSPQFAAIETGSREAAIALAGRLRKLPTVATVRSVEEIDRLAAYGFPIEPLRSGFETEDGRFAVYAYPHENLWDPTERDAFLADVESVAPGATGMPTLGRFMIARSRRALVVAGLLSAAIVAGLVWVDLRNLRLTILALLPTGLGLLALAGLMHRLGLTWNPIDVMALPVIIGIAVDDGVHIVHRVVAERGHVDRALASTGRSVLVTSLTSMAAFGSFAFAEHRGLASFGLVLFLGVGCALVLSLTVLPLALAGRAGRP